jgi:putative restriction endonuclease
MLRPTLDPDAPLRSAALDAIERLVARHGPTLPWSVIDAGFEWEGQRICLASKACGIFRPKEMSGGALSVRTSEPRKGRQKRYEDTPLEDGTFGYKFQDTNVDSRFNQWLQRAHELSAPLIYFLAVEPAVYQPIWPVYVQNSDAKRMEYTLVADDHTLRHEERGLPRVADAKAIDIRRQYVTTQAKRRLHQARFRLEVLRAYGERCAVCQLPSALLLEAAHIVPDKEEAGVASVSNGLALCRLHHGLFDADLMGIRPDGVIELHPSLLGKEGGPTLAHAIQPFHLQGIHFPQRPENQPAPRFLKVRYLRFLEAGGARG